MARYKHGYFGTPTYKSWAEMKYRCGNPKRKTYENVSYCERWEKFENFLEDMGERSVGMSLDRIDAYGNYEPSNCRWADDITQENNRTNNRCFLYGGEKLTIPQLARKYNIKRSTLAQRIYCYKWDIEKAITYKKGGK